VGLTATCACTEYMHVQRQLHAQVLRFQPEIGAAGTDEPPAALMRPTHTASQKPPLNYSALSQHLTTQELQAPKVPSAGWVKLTAMSWSPRLPSLAWHGIAKPLCCIACVKKRKEKTTPFGVNLMRSQCLRQHSCRLRTVTRLIGAQCLATGPHRALVTSS
jgi:hypothetical protein